MATMQLMAGTHFMQVSKWLGHGSFTLTLETYGDWIHEEDGGAVNSLPEPPASTAQSGPVAEASNVVQLFGRQGACESVAGTIAGSSKARYISWRVNFAMSLA